MVSTLAGRPVIVIAPRPSPLRALAGEDRVVAVLTSGDEVAGELAAIIDGLDGPVAVVIDDAELLTDPRAGTELEALVRRARDGDVVIVAATTTDDLIQSRFRGWLAEVRRSKAGLLVRPESSYDGEEFDVRLARSVGGGWPAGRALLIGRGRLQQVQIVQVQRPLLWFPVPRLRAYPTGTTTPFRSPATTRATVGAPASTGRRCWSPSSRAS